MPIRRLDPPELLLELNLHKMVKDYRDHRGRYWVNSNRIRGDQNVRTRIYLGHVISSVVMSAFYIFA